MARFLDAEGEWMSARVNIRNWICHVQLDGFGWTLLSHLYGSIQRMKPNQSPSSISSSLHIPLPPPPPSDLLASSSPQLLSRKMPTAQNEFFLVGWVEQVLGWPFTFHLRHPKITYQPLPPPFLFFPSWRPGLALTPSFLVFFDSGVSSVFVISRLSGYDSHGQEQKIKPLTCEHIGIYFQSKGGGVSWQCGDRRGVNRRVMTEMGYRVCMSWSAVEWVRCFSHMKNT